MQSITVSRGQDDNSYIVRARADLPVPCAHVYALHTQNMAHAFRDIGSYTSYFVKSPTELETQYVAGWGPFKSKVVMQVVHTKDAQGSATIAFRSSGVKSQGTWRLVPTSPTSCTVTLSQTFFPTGISALVPLAALLKSRVSRALDDMAAAGGKS